MKSTRKIVIFADILLVTLGLLILAAVAMGKGTLREVKGMTYEMKTFPVSGKFWDIHVADAECRVRILHSPDGECKVICPERTDGVAFHTVTVSDGVLRVQRHDERKWYQYIGVSFGMEDIEVYLPEKEYGQLTVRSTAGSIQVDNGFTFKSANLKSTSGSVRVCAEIKGELRAESTSGKVTVENTSLKTLFVKTSSGKIELSHIRGSEITTKATAGKIALTDVIAEKSLSAQNVSGGVEMDGCDGGRIRIKTTSGSVKGTLLSDKIFITDSTSGSVRVPRPATGGECEINTTSGNIRIEIKK